MNTLLISAGSKNETTLSDTLRRRGHTLTVVRDAEEAYTACQSGDYQLVILQVDGPDGDTVESCRRLRSVLPRSRGAILIAGRSVATRPIEDLLSAGADDYFEGLDNAEHVGARLAVVEHQLHSANRTEDFLRIQRDLGISLSSAANLSQAFDHVLQATFRIDGIDCGGVYLVDESTGDLHLAAHQGLSTPFVEAIAHCRADSVEAGQVMAGKPFYVRRSTVSDPVRQTCRTEGLWSVGVVPVCHKGRVIGSLNLASRCQDEVPTAARRLVEAIAASIGGAVARFKAEARLHDSERLYRTLVETAREGIGIADSRENIIFANRALAELLGYRLEEIVGRSLREFSDQEEFERFGIETEKRLRGVSSSYETKLRTKSGRPCWVILSAAPLYDEDGKFTGSVGLLTDVSERKRAEDLLRESEERYRLIADNVTDVIWKLDFPTPLGPAQLATVADPGDAVEAQWQRARYSYLSPSLERVFGYSVEEAQQMRPRQFITPASDEVAIKAISAALRPGTGEPTREFTMELECVRKDGSACWCEVACSLVQDESERIAGALGVLRDVSKRREAEKAMRASEVKLRTLFDNLPDFVVLVDCNAMIQFANRGVPGAPAEALAGSSAFDFITPEDQPRCREAFRAAIAEGKPHEVETRDVVGTWWACRVVPIESDGKVEHVMIICTDVSERKKSAAAIQEEQQLLRSLLDLHERDRQLIAYEIHDGVAQQLTGALYNLQAFKQLPRQDCDEARQTFEAGIELLGRSVAEVRQLIGGLRPPILDESGIVAAVDYLVCEAREREGLEIELLHDVRFERLAAPLETAVFRIVQESLNNACRHSRTDKIRVELLQQDHQVEISIRDWGVGFRLDEVEKQRFGLQGIRERARLLGGSATIETAPDRGTHVRVRFPVVEAATENAE